MLPFVVNDQTAIGTLIAVEYVIVEIRRLDGAVIPAERIKIALERGVLEPAAVAGVDLVAGKTALLGREACQIVLRQIARIAVGQEIFRIALAGGRQAGKLQPELRLLRQNAALPLETIFDGGLIVVYGGVGNGGIRRIAQTDQTALTEVEALAVAALVVGEE